MQDPPSEQWWWARAGQVAELLQRFPQVMLCKPSHNDRFDRRVVSLAAFKYRNGHLNVPEVRCRARCAAGRPGAGAIPQLKGS